MRLKRLELHGFKTFATKTAFEFPTGITAVVGPNGSGKCVTGETLVTLADGRDVPIRTLVHGALQAAGKREALDDGELTRENPHGIQILSLNPATLRLEPRPVAAFVKRLAPAHLLRVRTRAGREVTATPYHPFFTLEDGCLRALRADALQAGVRIAVPRRLPAGGLTVRRGGPAWPPVTPQGRDEALGALTLQSGVATAVPRAATQGRPYEYWSNDIDGEEIASVEAVASSDEWVYDLSVAETHNFVAGNIVVHNSNVADSVRWVLGEQAFSLMRGKRTDDMIFAGTELRPRMGMAMATLTLDNSDGTLPIDFSEVTITRRAFRSGENEYLLNGNRVRLRDINELLSKVGLSERTYAVLGQGLIDQALSLKADERRAIIEEAAGISLYQSKRDDALRRLDQTQRNLERVQDILAEIGPRMRALERQARRAQEVKRVQVDLENLLRVWYGYHWAHAKVSLRAARQEHELRFGEMAERRAALETVDREMTRVRSEAGGLRGFLGGLHRESSERHGRAEALQRELAVREERIRSLRAQREEILTELVTLRADIAVQAERVAQAQAESDRLESDRQERTQEVQQARTVLVDRESERKRLTGIADQARREVQRLASDRATRRARAADLVARSQALEADTVRSRDALAVQETELAALREEVARAEAAVAAMATRAAELGAARQSGEEQLVLVENELRALAARQAQAEAEEGGLHDRQILLERMRQELEGTAAGARSVVQAARAGELQGVRGTLAAVLRVPASLERAVEAVLGPEIDAVVVEDWAAAEAALAAGAGAVTLYALDCLRPNRPLIAPDVPFVTGNLARMLMDAGQDACYEYLVYTLFGRALVVRGRADALRLRRYLPTDSLAVTDAGERVTHGGGFSALTPPLPPAGGGAGGGKGGGAFAREREWRELPAQIEDAAARRREVTEALAAQEAVLKEWRRTLGEITSDLEALTQEQRAAQNDLQARHRALDRQAHEADLEATRLARQAEETGSLRAQAQMLEVEAEGLVQAEESAEARIREAQEQLAALAEGADVLTTRVSQAERAAAVAGEALRRHTQLLKDQEGALALLEQRGGARTERADSLEREAAGLAASNAGLQAQEAEIAAQLEGLRQRIAPAEERLQDLERAQASIEAAEADARTTLHAAEARATQAQLDLSMRQEELENLRRHIQEDLGLVELDLDEDISGQEPLPLDPLVTRLPRVDELPVDLEQALQEKRAQLRRMGAINPDAPAEYAEVSERHGFLSTQVADLTKAMADLQQVIAELDEMTKRDFKKTFDAVNAEFKEMFTRLFGGGAARLELSDPDDLVHTGIDIIARPPGKRLQPLALLSGGERALTAAALIFALLRVSPPPFCILDEVDAALDESNVVRFRDMLIEFQQQTQFIVITHNRGTMYAADTFYGITMSADGSSAAYSVRLVEDQLVQAK